MATGLHYTATLDDTDLKKKLADQRRMIVDSGKTAEAEASRVETMFKRVGIAAAGYFTAQQAMSFGQDIIRVRGERQMLEQSFEVLLQSRAKADKMISEITQLAINSPLEMTPVANAAQTLLGFGVDATKVMPILGQLSDVSMGNQQRFESLALVYAQVQSAGKLMGQDLFQMINAGFNPLTIIADQTGKSVAQLKDEMSKGAISADMVAAAFTKVTSEGGKFYQMTQKQADGIIGNQATFEDAIVQMKNKIGTNYEEIIKGGYKAATAVIENYEAISDAIMVLVATVGTYKASLIAVNALERVNTNVQYAAEIDELTKLLPAKQAEANADIQQAVAKGRLSQATADRLIAMRAEAQAELQSLQIKARVLAAEAAAASITHKAALQRSIVAKQNMALAQSQMQIAIQGGNADEIAAAKKAAQSAKIEMNSAAIAKNTTQQALGAAQSKSVAAATAANTMQTNINTASTTAAARAKGLLAAASIVAKNAIRTLGVSLASFLPFAIIAAVGMLASKLYEMATAETSAERASKSLGSAVDEEKDKLDKATEAITKAKKGTDERKIAIDNFNRDYGKYLGNLLSEKSAVEDVAAAYSQAKAAVVDFAIEKARESYMSDPMASIDKLKTQLRSSASNWGGKLGDAGKSGSLMADIDKIVSRLESGEKFSEGALYKVIGDAFVKQSGFKDNSYDAVKTKEIAFELQREFGDLQTAKNEFDSFSKAYRDASVATTTQAADNSTQAITTVTANLKSAAESLKKAKQELEDARTPTADQSVVKAKMDAVDSAQTNYDAALKLTGIDPKAAQSAATAAEKLRQETADAELSATKALYDAETELKRKQITDKIKLMEFDLAETLKRLEEQAQAEEAAGRPEAAKTIREQKTVVTQSVDIDIKADQSDQLKAEQDKLQSLLDQYQSYADQRKQIEDKFNGDIAVLRTQAGEASTAEEANRLNAAADLAEQKMGESVASLDIKTLKDNINWDSVFGDLSKSSTASISHTLEQVQQLFNLNKGDMSAEDIRDMTQAIEQMQDELAQRNPFGGLAQSFKAIGTAKDEVIAALNEYKESYSALAAAQNEYNAALSEQQALEQEIEVGLLSADSEAYAQAKDKVANAADKQSKAEQRCVAAENNAYTANNKLSRSYATFTSRLSAVHGVIGKVGANAKNLADIFDSDVADKIGKSLGFIDEVVGATTDVLDEIGKASSTVTTAISGTVDAASQGMVATGGVAVTTMSTMEKASVILAVISAALQIATAIAGLFNDDKAHQEEIDALQGRIKQLQWELDNIEVGRLKNNDIDILKNMRDTYAEVTREVLNLHRATNKYADFAYAFTNGAIYQNEIMAASVDKLAEAYAKVGYTKNKALGGAKYTEAQDALKNMAQQQLLLQQAIDEESAKSKDVDHDQIADWERQIQELGAEAIEMINGLVEDIIGGSSSDIAKDLGDAFFEAFQAGEDAAEAWGDKVDDIVADIMKRMLIQQYLEGPLGDVFNKYKDKWFGSGGFSLDTVIDSMGDFANDLMAEGDKFKAIWDNLPDNIKDMFKPSEEDREASQKGFASMSQDSANKLDGAFTAIQGHTYSINESLKQMQPDVSIIRSMMGEMMGNAARQLMVMQGIETNTRSLVRLERIESDMGAVKNALDDINLKGIKIR